MRGGDFAGEFDCEHQKLTNKGNLHHGVHSQETQASPEENGMGLDDLVWRGTRQVIWQAIEAELAKLLAKYAKVTTLAGPTN